MTTMTIRCKFRLDEITKTASNGASLKFHPVTGGSEENKSFFKWTPSGELCFYTVNDGVVDGIKLGGEYYIDITPSE